MGDDPNQRGNSRRWIVARGREQPAAAGHRLDRPLPDPPPRARHRHRRDARRAHRPRPRRARSATSAPRPSRRSAIVEAQWVAERRGRERFVCEQPPYSILVRGIEADVLPTCAAIRHGRDPLEPAGRRLADRPLPQGPGPPDDAPRPSGSRSATTCRCPTTRRKLEAADALAQLADEAGHDAHRAGARLRARRTRRSPRRSSARARWSSSSPSSAPPTSRSPTDVLDRIDEIVAAGHEPQRYGRGVAEPGAVARRAAAAEFGARSAVRRRYASAEARASA